MAMFEKVTDTKQKYDFCLTDCGRSDGCNPDDWCGKDGKVKIDVEKE